MSGTTPRRRFTWRRLRHGVAYALALLLILAGVAVGLAERLLPLLARHPEQVAGWLSERIGQPVEIAAVEARWSRSGPKLALHDLRIGAGAEAIGIGSAQLSVNVYSGLWPGIPFTELRIDALDLNLTRGAEDRRWRLEGFPAARGGNGAAFDLKRLHGLGALEVFSARLRVFDEADGRSLTIERADARMQREGDRVRFGLRAFRDSGATLRLAGVVSEDGRSGQLYAEGIAQDWAAWSAAWPVHGLHIGQARGDLRAWLDFSAGRIEQVRMETELAPLELVGEATSADAPPAQDGADDDAQQAPAPGLRFSRFSARLRWRRENDGWRIDAPQAFAQLEPAVPVHQMQAAGTPLEPEDDDAAPSLADLSIVKRGDGSLHAAAATLALEPALALLSAADALPEKLRGTLASAQPAGRVEMLDLEWQSPQRFTLSADLADVGWKAAGRLPSVRGIDGRLEADAALWRFAIAPGLWQVQAPGALRGPLAPRVQGELLAYPDDGGWRVETARLALSEPDQYDIELAGGAAFLPGGGVELSLRAVLGESPVVVAKRFLVVNVLPPPAVKWLDEALLDGRLVRGAALFQGDPRDWPFETEGRFEAQAEFDGLRLRYRDDWPQGEAVAGTARFINSGFDVDLAGRIGGAELTRVTGGIGRYREPWLDLSVAAQGEGAALLDVLRRSPLGRRHRNLIDGLSVGGRGEVAMQLHVPLKKRLGELQLSGQADLVRADLAHSGWGIAFDGASGRVRFSERGFSADELNVGFADSLGALNIAVGGYTAEAANVAEASLRGHFSAQGMIAAAREAQWLKPWLDGESDWTLQLSVPESDGDPAPPPKLRLRSDLAGTAIALPAPLRKASRGSLPLDLTLELPTSQGAVDLRLGSLLRLTGRNDPATGLTGVASFGDAPDAAPPARGLHIAGQVPSIDGGAWIGVVTSGQGGGGLHIASADLYAGELDLLGRPFRETRMRLVQHEGERVDFDFAGPMLQGQVQVPLAQLPLRGITAHLQKLVWPSAGAASAQDGADSVPPQAVPPLHLDIADLEFVGARLGAARLETWPTPDGLRVERLETHSPDLDLRAQGAWTLENGVERSSFSADLSSADLGAMLAALGFSRLVDGGPSVVRIALDWPGGPGAFDFARLNGELSANVGKGRVLEVEPGAGRLFGLLSLTEIPRRLSLDFSDFFKSGFAFNQMHGRFAIVEGDAATDDFRIDAPSAEIRISGRTGLATRDYDQRMEVLPKASNVLPAIGAIAGGPAGAAVGAVAQAVFQNPLKQMTRAVYQVSGPWSTPKIDRIERGAESGREVAPAP